MLSSAAAVVAGLFIGSLAVGGGGDARSRIGLPRRALVMELLSAVPFLCAVPSLFHQPANSTLLHAQAPGAVEVTLGVSELLPAVAVLPFMLYQLAGFGTLHYVAPRAANWVLNLGIFGHRRQLYRQPHGQLRSGKDLCRHPGRRVGDYRDLRSLKLRRMQRTYDARCPAREKKKKDKPDGDEEE